MSAPTWTTTKTKTTISPAPTTPKENYAITLRQEVEEIERLEDRLLTINAPKRFYLEEYSETAKDWATISNVVLIICFILFVAFGTSGVVVRGAITGSVMAAASFLSRMRYGKRKNS